MSRYSPRIGTSSRILVALLCGSAVAAAGEGPVDRSTGDFFETAIRPVLVESCQRCHGPKKQSSGLRLDSRESILEGGDSGPGLVPGKPEESLLIQAVSQTHAELKMPPKGRLPESSVSALRKWVELGAPWVESKSSDPGALKTLTAAESHWAFQPVRQTAPPKTRDAGWVRTPVDVFVLAGLESEGLTPSRPTDRATLIRRATLDLLGVPPTAEEIEAFEADPSPAAFQRVVDRLLASPRYGERWGRHWLDVARYADTKGYVFQEERKYPFAYTYRDYVIRSFNADLPFDQFVLQQLAADQLDLGGDPRPLAAMGFLTVGRRFLNDQNEIIDDRIDLVGRGLLGLSISCARCHDHKYDPIPSEDYYSLYGVFASSIEPDELPQLDPPGTRPSPEAESLRAEIAAARKARDHFLDVRRKELEADFHARFSRYLKAAYDLDLNPRNPRLEARAEAEKLDPTRLRAAVFLWKRRLDLTDARNDPVVGPLRRLADLPKADFAAKASELVQEFAAAIPGKPGGTNALVREAFREHPPANMEQAVSRFVALLASIESSGPKSGATFDPSRESLRQALFGPDGILAIPPEGTRFLLNRVDRKKYNDLGEALRRLQAKSAGKMGRAMVMKDAAQPVDPRVFIRGNPGRPGKPVPRQFLKVLAGPNRVPFQKGSGRLELARAVIDPANPLTARVLANRVWQWHFGQGLVTTPSDFGLRSEPPTHQELLDYLARALIDGGWSVKSLHRQIMLSSTYQQSSELRPDCQSSDPQNLRVWRFNRQRLDFETMRDSILFVAGSIDWTEGGPAVAITEPPFPPRRTVYGFIDRQNMDGVYRTFDFAVPDASSARRFVTTVPQQSLFLMNSPFIQQQARQLAVSLASKKNPEELVRAIYRRVLGRSPDARELQRASAFVSAASRRNEPLSPPAQLAQVLLLTNEFHFVD